MRFAKINFRVDLVRNPHFCSNQNLQQFRLNHTVWIKLSKWVNTEQSSKFLKKLRSIIFKKYCEDNCWEQLLKASAAFFHSKRVGKSKVQVPTIIFLRTSAFQRFIFYQTIRMCTYTLYLYIHCFIYLQCIETIFFI